MPAQRFDADAQNDDQDGRIRDVAENGHFHRTDRGVRKEEENDAVENDVRNERHEQQAIEPYRKRSRSQEAAGESDRRNNVRKDA